VIKKFKRQLLIIWTTFVLILTLMPTPDIGGDKEMYYDKIAHVFLFGIFSYLLFFNIDRSIVKKIIYSIIAGIGFSLLIEFLQVFIPGRDASHLDFIAGLFGILIFTSLSYVKNKE
jgi:VanZ family protein